MKKLLVTLLLLVSIPLYSLPLFHIENRITWDYPSKITPYGFKIYCSQINELGPADLVVTMPDPLLRYKYIKELLLPDGINYCAVTSYGEYPDSEFSTIVAMEIKDFDLISFAPGTPIPFTLN